MTSPPSRLSLPGLRDARRRAKLTQQELAHHLGVSSKHIAQLETGNAYVGSRALDSLVSWWAGVARCTPAEAVAQLCCIELEVNGEVFALRCTGLASNGELFAQRGPWEAA